MKTGLRIARAAHFQMPPTPARGRSSSPISLRRQKASQNSSAEGRQRSQKVTARSLSRSLTVRKVKMAAAASSPAVTVYWTNTRWYRRQAAISSVSSRFRHSFFRDPLTEEVPAARILPGAADPLTAVRLRFRIRKILPAWQSQRKAPNTGAPGNTRYSPASRADRGHRSCAVSASGSPV